MAAFPFMRLPTELRLRIYHYALRAPTRVGVDFGVKVHWAGSNFMYRGYEDTCMDHTSACHSSFTPSMLLVCRQVNEEATCILYSAKFKFERPYHLNFFVQAIGKNARHLKHVIVSVDCTHLFRTRSFDRFKSTRNSLQEAYALKDMTIELHIRPFLVLFTSDRFVDHYFKLIGPWMVEVGRRAGKKDAAIDLLRIRVVDWSYPAEQNLVISEEILQGFQQKCLDG